jgi:mannose/fructose/N-acetylgalactosamine-specific phosphotransferase system component IIC
MSTLTIAALLAWGVVAGLDFVSVLQAMVARPLVAATVAGVIAGDPVNGVLVGMALELYALEVLPVGGARSPDYGPGAVAAAAAARGVAPATLGLAVAVGLLVAYIGDWSIVVLRRGNTARVRRAAAELDAGDLRTISRVQVLGILWDAGRALGLTTLGLGVAYVARHWLPVASRATVLLTAVLLGVGLATAAGNAMRLGARRSGVWWLALGLAGGGLWIALR